ncbi:MAG TPA: inositol monophosphatase family protein, partial [Trebonia sp.]|nr:inositol monophosphatase family protein [Trebonia sp.]
MGRVTIADDHVLARDLGEQAGRLLLDLRERGGDADVLRKAGDRLSHEFLAAELAARRPDDAVLSEEGIDDKARLNADRVWIVDPLDGTREFGEEGRTDWAVHV